MKFLLFGTGDYYNRYKKWFINQEVLALLDNAKHKQYTFIDGLEVLPPEEGIRLNYDMVVILSFYVKQMKQQLISLGVDERKIFHFYDLHRLLGRNRIIKPMWYFLNAEELIKTDSQTGKKILLLSHDMTLGGPAIALFHAAEVLKKYGYEVIYASMEDGVLRKKLTENGIPVVVDENLQTAVMNETEWVKQFSLILCNTLNFHVFLSERDTSIPVLWWLHDASFFYDGVDREVIGKISLENLRGVTVGKVPEYAVREFLPYLDCGRLLYGVSDMVGESAVHEGSKLVRFITIGFMEERKGQDLLVQAVKMLHENKANRCEILMVGHNNTLFGEKIKKETRNMKNIRIIGSTDRETIHELLQNSDVLVCPSRQDPMPTVAAEAMMHSVPCIVSDVIGTADYIRDGEDGLIFRNGNVEELMEKIEWCISNKDRLEKMGKKARKLYEKYFSMKAFENSFLEIIDQQLKNNQQRS